MNFDPPELTAQAPEAAGMPGYLGTGLSTKGQSVP